MIEDPKRWSSASSDAPGALRQLLASGREPVGSPGEVESLRQRLAQALPPSAGLGDAPLPRPSGAALREARWLRPRWFGWAAAGVSTAALVWLAARPGDEKATPPAPGVAAPSTPPPAAPSEPAALQPTDAIPPAAVVPEALTGDTAREAPTEPEVEAPEPRARKARSAPTKPDEPELLRQAQSALAARPAEALALTREHERHFARGALREEREVLAIEALRRLGRSSAAADRARRFEKSYPRSVHLEKVRGAK